MTALRSAQIALPLATQRLPLVTQCLPLEGKVGFAGQNPDEVEKVKQKSKQNQLTQSHLIRQMLRRCPTLPYIYTRECRDLPLFLRRGAADRFVLMKILETEEKF